MMNFRSVTEVKTTPCTNSDDILCDLALISRLASGFSQAQMCWSFCVPLVRKLSGQDMSRLKQDILVSSRVARSVWEKNQPGSHSRLAQKEAYCLDVCLFQTQSTMEWGSLPNMWSRVIYTSFKSKPRVRVICQFRPTQSTWLNPWSWSFR